MHTQRSGGPRAVLALAGLLLALAACSTGPTRVVVPVQEVKLGQLENQLVEFTGEIRGPGVRGDYLLIADTEVFLDKLDTAGRHGQRVSVAGRLRYFRPPTAADCADGCENADVPPHYWIEDGKFVTPSAPPAQ